MMMKSQFTPSSFQILALVIFILALAHTFSCSFIHKFSHRFPKNSVNRKVFTLFSEVELVFGVWAIVLITGLAILQGPQEAIHLVRELSFTEAFFVFVIMAASATKPIINAALFITDLLAKLLPLPQYIEPYLVICGIIPLFGSFITEPATMTVCALLLNQYYLSKPVSTRFKYLSLAVLFVNVSIGGALTPYAAPPVIMVAKPWGWDIGFMMTHFGYKVIIACFLNAGIVSFILKDEIKKIRFPTELKLRSPLALIFLHAILLLGIILSAHEPNKLGVLFLALITLVYSTRKEQSPLKFKESLLVALFLGGIVTVGHPQQWWLSPIISQLSPLFLNLSATALTAITDNAALTYLGTLVPTLTPEHQYALMSGALTGGGLTLIANAPNPAGAMITKPSFPGGDILASKLFVAALGPTLIAWICVWGLPTIRF